MSDSSSLGSQLKDDILADLPVSITAVVLAMLALGGVTISGQVGGGLFLAIPIAVFIPYVYEDRWPVVYDTIPAIGWTITAAIVTTALYLGSYVLFEEVVSAGNAEPAAFVVTAVLQYGIASLYAALQNSD